MSGQATPFQASPAPKDHPAGPPARTGWWLGALAIAGGICFLVVAWIGATNPTFHGDLNSTIEYLNDAFGSAALALTIPGLIGLRGVQGAPRAAVETAATGQLLIVSGVLAGLLLGQDPAWFPVVGIPGNLLWLIGTVRIARHTWKARVFPRWTAIALALTVPVGMVLGEFGGSALPGVLWIYLGWRLVTLGRSESVHRLPQTRG